MTAAKNTATRKIPYGLHWIDEAEVSEVTDTLRHGYLTSGPKVERFEKEFAEYCGVPHGVAVSSCSAALHLSMIALGVGPGDEVLTTPMSYVATSNAILHAGATPVFADIDARTFNLDPSQIERKINPRTKGILVVHYGGQPCDMDPILEIAVRHRLFVVEDASHAVHSAYKGRRIGSLSHATAFSFHPVKNMTTAEGGMVTTGSRELAEKIRCLRLHGIVSDYRQREKEEEFEYPKMEYLGFKYNMTDVQASVGLAQLRKIEAFTARRREIADFYSGAFKDIPELEVPYRMPGCDPVWHLYVIKLALERLNVSRGKFMKALLNRNIVASVHYLPIHLQPYYRKRFGFKPGDFPVAESAYERMISIPLFPKMTDADAGCVAEAVIAAVCETRRSGS
jgi:dTDP-4-amino-4,6-dideoxygalactose transaminase